MLKWILSVGTLSSEIVLNFPDLIQLNRRKTFALYLFSTYNHQSDTCQAETFPQVTIEKMIQLI